MSQNDLFLYGTEEPAAAARQLAAGQLSARLGDDGALRDIRWRGVEVLRAITFLVRTAGWGTPSAAISGLTVENTQPDRFTVAYDARVDDGVAQLDYRIEIAARADGSLHAQATISTPTGFVTNRTGFVVLHPLVGVAGQPVDVLHVDGRHETVTLDAAINPAQPLREIRAITTHPRPDLSAHTCLEGDTFEMEDQRNWSDASFKTYSRPLTLPFPYILEPGATSTQSVILNISDANAGEISQGTTAHPHPVHLRLGPLSAQRVPRIGIALPGELARASLAVAPQLRDAAPRFLLAHFDASLGHGDDALRAIAELARAIDVPVTLEIIVAGQRSPDDELREVARRATLAGLAPAAVAVYPKVDEKSYQPGQPRPPSPELGEIYRAARSHFPGIALGGGSPALFTELNRKHPPAGLLDFVAHASCPIVHDPSDAAIMQTLETLPWIAHSVRHIAAGSAYHIGPVAIGTRLNPYGEAPTPNPDNRRVGLAQVDPRQRGLFGAAWYLAYAAAAAKLDVAALTLSGSIGAFGIVHRAQAYAQPWFDALAAPAVFPAFHVLAELARASGRPLLEIDGENAAGIPSRVAALAWLAEDDRPRLALANLTADAQRVRIDGLREPTLRGRVLDSASFAPAALDWRAWRGTSTSLAASEGGNETNQLELAPYALAFVGDAIGDIGGAP